MEGMGNEVETALYPAGTSLITAPMDMWEQGQWDSSHRTISDQAPQSCF